MFEDIEDGVDVSTDSPDRTIAWAIWSRSEDANVTIDEAWGILHERYPDDPRFLLLNAYTELSETRKHSERHIKAARDVTAPGPAGAAKEATPFGLSWSPGYFLQKVERLVASTTEALHAPIRDLLVFGSGLLGAVSAAQGDERARLLALREKIGAGGEEPKRDDRDRAAIRLRRFEREVLKEIEERTQDGQALGVPAPRATGDRRADAAGGVDDWASLTQDTDKPRRKYAADARFARGDLVEHPKFGVGVVTGTEPGKAVILFESGVRKLVAGA